MFTVCSFNIGTDINSYKRLSAYHDPELKLKNKEEVKAFVDSYKRAQETTANACVGLDASVFCFQGVAEPTRPFIAKFKDKYTIVHVNAEKVDCAVALRRDQFKNIVNHSFTVQLSPKEQQDVAIALATNRLTGQKVCFVSLHLPDAEIDSRKICVALAEKVAKIAPGALQIIGSDMFSADSTAERFKILLGSGFSNYGTGKPNCVYQSQVETSYFWEKSAQLSFFAKLKSIFFRIVHFNSFEISTLNEKFSFHPNHNCTNHLPIFCKVTAVYEASKICELFKKFLKLIGIQYDK